MTDTTIRRHAWAVATLHAVLALFYWLALGVSIVHDFGQDTWGWFYQNIPTALLLERPFESLWYLHAQPPLWNALGALFIELFGSLHLTMLQLMHVGLGAATAAMSVHVVARTTGSSRLALATGLVIALHPALLLYEAYALYTTLVAFLVTLGAYLVSSPNGRPRPWAAVGLFAVLGTLVLTRSVYHLGLLVLALPLVLVLTGRPTRRQALVLALALALPFGWYAKNKVQYGFFGASSWYGMGLWRAVLFDQDQEVLRELYERGDFELVVQIDPFTPPSAYRPLGFDEVSDVPVLARDDQHNKNIPAISAAYQRSAVALLRRSPGQYVRNVLTAYGNFSAPSSDFVHLAQNRDRIRWHADLERWILLRPLTARVEAAVGNVYFGSLYFLLFPTVLVLHLVQLARRAGGIRALPSSALEDAAPFYIATMVVYTIAISCAMELGENLRFKVMVEPVFLILTAVVAHRTWSAMSRTGTAEPPVAEQIPPE